MNYVSEWIMWIIVASIVVLIVMNPDGFVKSITGIGTVVNNESKTLSGTGYVRAR